MSNIFFNVKEARDFLLENGFVYIIRKKRSTGKATAVFGSYRKNNPIAVVNISQITIKPVLERREFDSILNFYVEKSGFKNLSDWLKAVIKFKTKENMFLYEVTIIGKKIQEGNN